MSNSTSATLLAAPPQHHEHLQQQLAQSWDCDLSKLGIDSCNRKNLLKNTPLMQKIMATVAESHISLDSQHARHVGALLVKLASFSSSNPFLSTCHYHTSMALGSPSSSSPSSSSATTPLGTAILTTTTTSTTTATTSTTLPFSTMPTSTSSKAVKPSSLLHPSSSVSKQQQQPSSLSSTPPTATFRALLATLIGNGKLTKPLQLDEAVKYLKALHQRHLQLHPQQLLLSQPLLSAEQQDGLVSSSSSSSLPSHSLSVPIVASINLNVQEFEQQCGIGLNFSEDDIRKHLYNYIRDHRREITEFLMQHQPQQNNNNNNNNESQQSSSTACIAKLIGKMKQQLQQEQVQNNNSNNNNNIALGQVLKWADFNVVSSILRELIIERECANSSPIEHDSNSNNSNNSSNNNNGNSYYNNSRRLLNQGNSVVPPPLQISSAAPVQQQDVELLQEEEEEGNNQNHQDLPLPPPLPSSSSSSRTNSSPQNFALRLQQQQQQQQNACSNTILSSGSSFSNQYHGKRRNSQAPPSAAASAQPRPNYGRKFSFVRELDTAVNFSSAGGSSAHHSSFHNFQYFANSGGSCEQLLQQQQQPQHIITRFPPEPNGFLHLGHAKAMHLNFSFAQSTTNTVPTPPSSSSSSFSLPSSTATDQQLTEAASGASLAATSVITTDNTAHQQASDISSSNSSNNSGSGETILRFDDTNPEVEDINFVNSIKEMCDWMGYKYSHITYTSQYFDQIYERAKMLIERERAYVDLSDRTVITMLRNKGEPSPYRDKFTVQENLKLFEDMKHGKYEEGAAVLRLKIDYKHCNLNMRDPIAYRIKFVPHFKEGNKWCIYPTYDFSHCIVDSLERITHSLCTMEFEVRRDLYYWILTALDNMYKPHVWEFSRLNVTNSVMSKRTMSDLVKRGIVRGWDDPRLLTLAGLKRRGYTPTSIKKFCDMIGVSRNENLIPLERLEQCLRDEMLHQQQQHRAQPQLQEDGTSTATAIATCTRAFCVREPLKVVLENVPENYIENFFMHYCEQRPELGSRALPFSRVIYIERRDFKEHDEEGFYGLALNKFVRLRLAAYPIKCTRVIREEAAGESGKIIELRAIVDFERKEHPRGTIHWLGQDANGKDPMRAELRLYEPLFIEQSSAAAPKLPVAPSAAASVFENVDGEHSSLVINKNSLTIVRDAFVDPLFAANRALRCKPYEKYQFERQGIFSVDPDTTDSLLVLNRTVSAKESYHKFS